MKIKGIDKRTIFVPCGDVKYFLSICKNMPCPNCSISGVEYYIGSCRHYDTGVEYELISKEVIEIEIEGIDDEQRAD